MSTIVNGMRLAVGTFTRIPSGAVTLDPPTPRTALLLAPVAVAPLAVAVGLVGASVEVGLPPFVIAALALMVLAHGSRGMHLDGLGDTVDALGAGWDRERALAVMRSGDVGPMGVVALVLVLLVQAGAIADVLVEGWPGAVALAAAVLVSRTAAAVACSTGVAPAAGSRLGAAFVGTVPPFAAALIVAVGAALIAGLALGGSGDPRAAAIAGTAVLLAALGAVALRRRVATVLGGINGDTIGAAIEVALTVMLVGLAVAW